MGGVGVGVDLAAFQDVAEAVIGFCQRQSAALTEEERQRVWLSLLDRLLAPQRAARKSRRDDDDEAVLSGAVALSSTSGVIDHGRCTLSGLG